MTASVHLRLFSSHHTIELKQSCMQLMASFLKHQDLTLRYSYPCICCWQSPSQICLVLAYHLITVSPKKQLFWKSPGLQTMYTPSPIKSAGVNSDQLWLCPCHPKTQRRNSLRRLQQTILHHCTPRTSANSFGMRGCQCAFYSERESEIRDINCKHTSICIHYQSNDHFKAQDVTNAWKKVVLDICIHLQLSFMQFFLEKTCSHIVWAECEPP